MGVMELGFVSFHVSCVKAANCIDPLRRSFAVAVAKMEGPLNPVST